MWSLLDVLVSEFRLCFTLCLFIILLVQFGLLGGRLLGGGCPLGWRFVLVVFGLFVILVYFPLWFLGGGVCLLIAPVPVHCFSITFIAIIILESVLLYDDPDLKLFILVGWDRSLSSIAWPTGLN